MPSRHDVDDFLAQRHIAVVGVSRDTKQFANGVYRTLRDGGRTLYPVNAHDVDAVEGDRCYSRLADVPDPVDGVLVMVPADAAAGVVAEALERGIPRVWLHRGSGAGSVSAEAVELCRAKGVPVVDGACPLMFAEPVAAVHRFHRFFARRHFAA